MSYGDLDICLSITISEGSPLTYRVGGSNQASFVWGDLPRDFDISLEYEPLREFLKAGAQALSEMDKRYAERYPDEQPATVPDSSGGA